MYLFDTPQRLRQFVRALYEFLFRYFYTDIYFIHFLLLGLIENVVMFKFKADDFTEIDRDRYPMKDVSMFDIGAPANGSQVK